jgi:drug/metabolite transporter (DMT)-like permease
MVLDSNLKRLNKMLKGIFFVLIGAASYGVLATVVKLAYLEGYNVSQVTFAQYSVGFIVLWLLAFLNRSKQVVKPELTIEAIRNDKVKLVAAGTSLGLTGLFYYSSVQTIDVSICIVLLMQSVWMGVVLEGILERAKPRTNKIIAAFFVIIGTIFATDAYSNYEKLDLAGLIWGMLAALSYTVSLYTANRVGLRLSNPFRSAYMMSGAWLVITIAMFLMIDSWPGWEVFYPWGIYLALFGTIIPPLFLNKGFPLTGIGLGSILVSIEIPISVLMAITFLNESVKGVQIAGILIILLGIVVLNFHHLRSNRDKTSLN